MSQYNSYQPVHAQRVQDAPPRTDSLPLNLLSQHQSNAASDPVAHIPRPRNPFFIFRSEFASKTCLPSQSELSKVAGNAWRNMGEDEQQPFKVRADEEKQEHYRKYPNYIYKPKRKSLPSSAVSVPSDGQGSVPSSKSSSRRSGNAKTRRGTSTSSNKGRKIAHIPAAFPNSSPSLLTPREPALLDGAPNIPPTKRRIQIAHNMTSLQNLDFPGGVRPIPEKVATSITAPRRPATNSFTTPIIPLPTFCVSKLESLQLCEKPKTPEPMFGLDDNGPDLSCRPLVAMPPVVSPASSPAATHSNEVCREQSIKDELSVTPETLEPPVEETPPLGRFEFSSLVYLMDKHISVSPPHSPAPTSVRSLTLSPSPREMDGEPSTALFTAMMQDVLALKMQKLTPEAKLLQEQFGIQFAEETGGQVAQDDTALWASLPEGIVKRIMAEQVHTRVRGGKDDEARALMAVDELGGEFEGLTGEFKNRCMGQLKDDLEFQLQEMVGQFRDELGPPLQDALELQLKNEIIMQAKDQMMETLVILGEDAKVEFEWRSRFVEQLEDDADTHYEVIQHPLQHLFIPTEMSTDMDVRMPASMLI